MNFGGLGIEQVVEIGMFRGGSFWLLRSEIARQPNDCCARACSMHEPHAFSHARSNQQTGESYDKWLELNRSLCFASRSKNARINCYSCSASQLGSQQTKKRRRTKVKLQEAGKQASKQADE